MLQQYLPFTVLKLSDNLKVRILIGIVATVLTVYGIETATEQMIAKVKKSCNSTYRLRY